MWVGNVCVLVGHVCVGRSCLCVGRSCLCVHLAPPSLFCHVASHTCSLVSFICISGHEFIRVSIEKFCFQFVFFFLSSML